MNKPLIAKIALVCMTLLATAGVVLINHTASAESVAGEYVWITRAWNDPGQEECQQHSVGSECVELCIVSGGGVISMNKYCCIDPTLIGGWDNPVECDHWL